MKGMPDSLMGVVPKIAPGPFGPIPHLGHDARCADNGVDGISFGADGEPVHSMATNCFGIEHNFDAPAQQTLESMRTYWMPGNRSERRC